MSRSDLPRVPHGYRRVEQALAIVVLLAMLAIMFVVVCA
jgi:hypothetical protein